MTPRHTKPHATTLSSANDDALLQGICEQLDEHAEGLDAATASRLHSARNRAIEAARQGGLRQWFSAQSITLWAGSSLATAALAVVMLIANPLISNPLSDIAPSNNDNPLAAIQLDTDLEILASNDGLDLYQDIDFYMWLSDQPTSPNLAPSSHEVRPSPEHQAS